MLYDDLLDSENPHIATLVRAFKMLEQFDFKDDMPYFFESLRAMSKIEQFDVKNDKGDRIYITHNVDPSGSNITNFFYKENISKDHYDAGVAFVFNDKRLLSLRCTVTDDIGDPVFWVLYFTNTKIIQENHLELNFKYSNLKEYQLQYDVVCPLASYFLEYGDRV